MTQSLTIQLKIAIYWVWLFNRFLVFAHLGIFVLALKVTNGSYIMNGEFAVSAPGTYDAAGARFLYTREAGLDKVLSHGPLHHSIDIMVILINTR